MNASNHIHKRSNLDSSHSDCNSHVCIQSLEGESETSPRDDDPVASCVPHCYTQDVTLACCLPPGAYTIVPSTYQPDCSASFTLSLARRIHRLVSVPV